MIIRSAGALGCVLALAAVPTAGAVSGARSPDGPGAPRPVAQGVRPVEQLRHCRLLPESAQPKVAPRAARRTQQGTAMTVRVVVPATTCNRGH
ncbi:hypothetical protein [Marmoricola sp. RAF53]|uniref:hypothetical protein n=1 Tax=Marmoricola sp. RAF53 TaxID=3233059 RepID=UPI003F9EAE54